MGINLGETGILENCEICSFLSYLRAVQRNGSAFPADLGP